jgi:hypothetical protein
MKKNAKMEKAPKGKSPMGGQKAMHAEHKHVEQTANALHKGDPYCAPGKL